jgi:hypothetical protein
MTDKTSPAEAEYKHARMLMNAQELGWPVVYKGTKHYIQEFQRFPSPIGAGWSTAVYLAGNPELIPASEITIKEEPK